MRVSVAMTTYNGEKNLEEQLRSILNQTKPPQELVVSDDSSSDRTLEILEEFKSNAPFEVKININSQNLGFNKNFEKALSLCTGDLIFISDHDDRWFDNKIETMTNFISSNQGAYMAMNDCEIADSELNGTGISKLNQVISYQGTIDGFIPGCCSVIRSDYKSLLFPFSDLMSYDSWISFIGINTDSRVILEEILQFYRRYENNTTNHPVNSLSKISTWYRYKKGLVRIFSPRATDSKIDYNSKNLKSAEILLIRIRLLIEETEKHNLKRNLSRMQKALEINIRRFKEIESLITETSYKRFLKSCIKLLIRKMSMKDFLYINF